MLVLDPEVLLLDEPTAALDPRSQSQIIDLLIEWGDGKKTVITATHDLGLVEDIADDCFLLQSGKLVAHGAPADILGRRSFTAQQQFDSRTSARAPFAWDSHASSLSPDVMNFADRVIETLYEHRRGDVIAHV